MRRWLLGAGLLFVYVAGSGLVVIDWTVEPHSRLAGLLFLASTLVLACVLLGALIARWWAPSLALALIALPLVPDRCVWRQTSSDSFGGVCSGIGDDVPLFVGLVCGALLVGTALATVRGWVAE